MNTFLMDCCYVLFSEHLQRHYIGVCHTDLQSRIKKHNLHEYGEHRYTAKASDWKLKLCIECSSYKQAIKIEKHIKRMKSADYIGSLLKFPEMSEKLKEKYKL
jgi:putative endonuclease